MTFERGARYLNMATEREAPSKAPGLAVRRIAAEIVEGVLRRKRSLDELLEAGNLNELEARDRALLRAIVATVIRRLGTLRHLLSGFLDRGLPANAPRVESTLLIG